MMKPLMFRRADQQDACLHREMFLLQGSHELSEGVFGFSTVVNRCPRFLCGVRRVFTRTRVLVAGLA